MLKEGQIINRLMDEYRKTQKIQDKDLIVSNDEAVEAPRYVKSKSGIVIDS